MLDQDLVAEWVLAKAKLDQAKDRELDLRLRIAESVESRKSRAHIETDDFKVTVVFKTNFSIDDAVLQSMREDLTIAETACFKYVPKLVMSQVKNMPKSSKIWKAISSKPGTPGLEVKEK